MKKKLYLHIGIGKTGSTAIQAALEHRRHKLLKKGYLFPVSPGRGHGAIAQIGWPDEEVLRRPFFRTQTKYATPDELRMDFIANFRREIGESNATSVIVSNETIHLLPKERFDWLIEFLMELFAKITVVIFIRRQDDFLISYYKQGLISGQRRTFGEYLDTVLAENERTLFTPVLDFANLLDGISERHPDIEIRTELFHKEHFATQGLLGRFAQAVDLEEPDLRVDGGKIVNQSLDANCAEYLRRYNCGRPEELAPDTLVNALKTISGGQEIEYTAAEHENIIKKFEFSNRRVSCVYLTSGGDFLTKRLGQSCSLVRVRDSELALELVNTKLVEQLQMLHDDQLMDKKLAWKRFSASQKTILQLGMDKKNAWKRFSASQKTILQLGMDKKNAWKRFSASQKKLLQLGAERDAVVAERDAVVAERDTVVAERDAVVADADARRSKIAMRIDLLDYQVHRLLGELPFVSEAFRKRFKRAAQKRYRESYSRR